MPKKRPSSNFTNIDQGPLEKSLSSPEISEIAKEFNRVGAETDDEEAIRRDYSQKQRKGSWLSRLIRTFRRKRRKTTEPFSQPPVTYPVQKSPSAQFYTPPSSEFLVKAITINDEVDKLQPNSENDAPAAQAEIKRDTSTRGSKKLYDKPPNFITELKKTLKEESKDDDVRRENDPPMYSNMSDLKNPASTRRKPRPLSADSETIEHRLSDLDSIYEPTWKVMPNEKKPKSILKPSLSKTEEVKDMKANPLPDFEPQPIKPLYDRFSKPKPPVNRRPSTRRGSQPEVHIRNGHSESGSDKSHRRSNAELEEVIQKLSDIPAPSTAPAPAISPITPTPRKRTKFFGSEPDSPPIKEIAKEDDENKKGQTSLDKNNETESSKAEELWEKALSIVKQIEHGEIIDEDRITSERRVSLTRNNSFPKIKLLTESEKAMLVVVGTMKNDSPKKENGKSSSCENLEPYPLKRWNTMPTRYYLQSGKSENRLIKPSTILVVPYQDKKQNPNTGSANDLPQIAVLLNSEVRPTTQTISTQTCSTLSTEITREKAVLNSQLDPELIYDEVNEYIVNSTETELNDQNTPPNTPGQEDSENDSPDVLDNNCSKTEIVNFTKYQQSAYAASAQHREASTFLGNSVHTHTFETVSNDYGKILRNTKEIETYLPNESLSKFRSDMKQVSKQEGYYSETKSGTVTQHETVSSKVGLVSSTTHVQKTVVSGQDITLVHSNETKIPPIKPLRLTRKPPITPKPEILLKPQDFIRRGALRQKRNSTSEEQSFPPTSLQPMESRLSIHDASSNNREKRRSSLFQEINEPKEPENQKEKRRNKSIV